MRLSQAIARVVCQNRASFADGIALTVAERERVMRELAHIPGVEVFPSDANFVLVRMEGASGVWEDLYARGVLVRDFSRAPRPRELPAREHWFAG